MKRIHLYRIALGVLLFGGVLQSCEDYLTVYPTDQITEEKFFQDKNDLNNVRAGAYWQLTRSSLTSKILIWGEMRSDNFSLNDMNSTDLLHLQNAVLMPTESMFDWADFYTGINYCNLVLTHGEDMIARNVDPSFGTVDWRPIKAEMQALRALYYFYLVKAFRDVPFVTEPVTTDKQAMAARIAATPGVAIIGSLIDSLEVAKNYAAGSNFSTASDNKGRFTKRSIRALLADLYLWRGCMLQNLMSKEANTPYSRMISLTDDVSDSIAIRQDGTQDTLSVVTTAEGVVVDQAYCDQLAQDCFAKAKEHCTFIIDEMKSEYDLRIRTSRDNISDTERTQQFPLTRITLTTRNNVRDAVYQDIFADQNSNESIFELQYNGSNTINSTLTTYLTSYYSGSLSATKFVVNPSFASLNSNENTKGFGRTDFRMAETMRIVSGNSTSTYPYVKNIAASIIAANPQEMGRGITYTFRNSSTQNANWPVYRLSDIMLIKAEAIARSYAETTKAASISSNALVVNNREVCDAFDLVNRLYERCNPGLNPSTAHNTDYVSARLNFTQDINYYPVDKTVKDLLTLVYQERQREFVGEGKFWFDLVRQAEATNDATTALTSYMAITTAVKNRLKRIYSLYNPIYADEMKVNGVDAGGMLNQNPIWDRYTK